MLFYFEILHDVFQHKAFIPLPFLGFEKVWRFSQAHFLLENYLIKHQVHGEKKMGGVLQFSRYKIDIYVYVHASKS